MTIIRLFVGGLLAGLALLAASVSQAMAPITSWHTQNGAKVMYVQAEGLPMIDVRLLFNAGSARDDGQAGLAALTNDLLDQGAGSWSADEIAERLEQVGAELDTGAERDMAWLSLRSLSDPARFQPAIEVLDALVSTPRFASEDFERERKRTLVGIQYASQKPAEVAKKAFWKALYGDHPYASPVEGTEASVSALKRDDLVHFYRRYYVARNLVIAIVGDIDRPAAESLAERLSNRLPAGATAPALPPVPDLKKAVEIRQQLRSTQTHILMGQPGMKRQDPDYFSLYVGNYILGGGGLVSRVIDEIREQRGLAYSAYSYFLPMARKGPFQMGLQTRNEKADEALTVLRDTLKRFIEAGPTAKELEAAKKNITGGYPLRIDSNSKILGYIAMIGFYDLPLDYLETFNSRIEAVTLEQVTDAFKRRVNPERLATVVVGGASK